jgi:DNA-binding MarR family transcriptional regulator
MRVSAEKELKPGDYDRCNLIALRQATRQATQFYESHFETVGLRATQFGILQRLDGVGPISINELANTMVMDAATMGRALKPLQRDGYVAIGPGRDGRTRGLKLTKSGAAKLKEAWAAWRKATAAFEARIGGAEMSSNLREALRHVVSAAGPQ